MATNKTPEEENPFVSFYENEGASPAAEPGPGELGTATANPYETQPNDPSDAANVNPYENSPDEAAQLTGGASGSANSFQNNSREAINAMESDNPRNEYETREPEADAATDQREPPDPVGPSMETEDDTYYQRMAENPLNDGSFFGQISASVIEHQAGGYFSDDVRDGARWLMDNYGPGSGDGFGPEPEKDDYQP